MRKNIVLAAILLIVAAGVAVWLLPDVRSWDGSPASDRIAVATLITGLLALAATLVTILAALDEIRHVFPKQRVSVSTTRREYLGAETRDDTYQLIFENPSDSPIINTLRIYVRLVRSSAQLSDADWLLQASCERNATLGDELPIGDETEAIDIPIREIPYPGTWLPHAQTFRPPWQSKSLDWVFERENPWFPSVLVQGPEVTLTGGRSSDEYRWIVMWWTERLGPVSLVVRL